jgi:uncharacterized protein YlzI (FlbEa/FlbD family)
LDVIAEKLVVKKDIVNVTEKVLNVARSVFANSVKIQDRKT